jgi:3-oxoadipate enol-lactonase
MTKAATTGGLSTAHWDKAILPDGTGIAHELRRSKTPGAGRVVLIHALAMNGRYWDEVTPHLADVADVLVYDCRGHGASDRPAGAFSAELFARDLAGLMDAVGWQDAVVAGASMGGCVALAFVRLFPERVQGLGLIDTTAWYGEDAPAAWAGRGQTGRDKGMAALTNFQLERWFSEAFRKENPDLVNALLEVFCANDTDCYYRTCMMLGGADERPALPGITVPTEIMVGSEDYATPPDMARALEAAIPGARMTLVEGARHFTPLEIPDQVAALLRALLAART